MSNIPDEFANIGWLRAVDDELTGAHIGVANLSDSYESARAKLNSLICWHIAVATDPAVNGGYSLQKVEDVNWEAIAADQALTTVFDVQLMEDVLEALKAIQNYARWENKGLRICDEAIESLKERLKKV
jgi:hypothetical protein